MKTLTRSQWMNQEIQTILNGSVQNVKLLLYPKEMRKLKKNHPELHYTDTNTKNKRKSDTRILYKITL